MTNANSSNGPRLGDEAGHRAKVHADQRASHRAGHRANDRAGPLRSTRVARTLALLSLASLLVGTSGCATMIKGTTQTITVHVDDENADVRYYGRPVPEGRLFRVEKRPGPPHVVYRTTDGDLQAPLEYDMDPLFIVDCLLLIPGVLPGVIAISVDLATGAWRDLHQHQHVSEPSAPPAGDRDSSH